MNPHLPTIADALHAPAMLTPEEFRRLARRIPRNATRSEALFRVATYSLVVGTIAGALASIWVGMALMVGCWVVYGLVVALVLGLFIAHARKDGREAERLIRFITCTQDAALLGPILNLKEAAMHPSDLHLRINSVLDDAVLRLLPLLQATDASLLNRRQRTRIGSYFWAGTSFTDAPRGFDDLPYARAVLQAMHQIGDQRDALEIERLLDASSITEELRTAIQQCVAAIRERVAWEQSSHVLLRADHKPQAIETLLHPSQERADTPPQQLLRAGAADSGDMPV